MSTVPDLPPLHLRGARVVLRPRGGPPTVGVDGVDLDVGPGEVVALLGESGSGKTTLARAIAGLQPLEAGELRLSGAGPSAVQLLFQDADAHLPPAATLGETLMESARRWGRGPDEARAALRALGLDGLEGRRRAQLSGGERRRAGVARLCLARPRLILADEPTAGLDAHLALQAMDALLASRPPGGGALIITHDLRLARALADRVVVMLRGRVVEEAPAAALGAVPHHPLVASLLGAAGLGPGPVLPPAPPARGGCPLAAVCPRASPPCAAAAPTLRGVAGRAGRVACTDLPPGTPP